MSVIKTQTRQQARHCLVDSVKIKMVIVLTLKIKNLIKSFKTNNLVCYFYLFVVFW